MGKHLKDWLALNAFLQKASEHQCRDLLVLEQKNKARTNFLLRIFGKYNQLRGQRERRELLAGKQIPAKVRDTNVAISSASCPNFITRSRNA